MNAATKPRTHGIFRRISKTWAELDYAQRRLLEIRTGVPLTNRREDPTIDRVISEMESQFSAPNHYAPELSTDRGR